MLEGIQLYGGKVAVCHCPGYYLLYFSDAAWKCAQGRTQREALNKLREKYPTDVPDGEPAEFEELNPDLSIEKDRVH